MLDKNETSSGLVELLSLAGPTVAQMASYTLMMFFDRWMLAQLGHFEPTAAGTAGMFAFSVISLGMGVLFVVNTLVSQSFGRRDFAACGQNLWQGLWFAVIFAALVAPALPIIGGLFTLLKHEPQLAHLESIYIQIVLCAAVLKLTGTAIGQFLLAINRARDVLFAAIAAVSINAIAAWIMIFGKLGVKPMGIVGAAWAQNIGVGIELICLIGFALRPSIRKMFHLGEWRLRPALFRTLLFVGIPSGIQIVADVLAWSLFVSLVMAQFGEKTMAATNFMFGYMVVSFMPAFGLSTAVTALVGRYIGMGRFDIARKRAHLGFAVAGTYMLLCGLGFFLGRHLLMRAFTDDPVILQIGATLLGFAAVYQFFDALYITYNGALRGAGDTFVPAMATAILNWSMNIMLGYFVASHFKDFGPKGPWLVATSYGAILGIFIFTRFWRGSGRAFTWNPPTRIRYPLPIK